MSDRSAGWELDAQGPRIVDGSRAGDGYWPDLAAGEFRLPRCASCGAWRWPAHFRCTDCGGWEQAWVEVELVGVVYS